MDSYKILKFAQKSVYNTVEYLGKWIGYDVYEPGFSDGEPRFIGFPMFILVKGDAVRWTEDWQESRAIMKRFYPSN